MPYSVVDKGSKYFNTVTWTGTGSAMSITGVGFQPDWVWYKGRSFAYNHGLFDAVRGTTNFIKSNSTDAEATVSGVSAFNSDGFSLGTDLGAINSGTTYVAWNWLGANTTVSNTSGSITSTVSANTTSGFSIVSYTGNSTAGTVGHGLGVAPSMMIIKDRTSGAYNWTVYHASIGNTRRIILNSTAGQDSASSGWWNNTSPTSTVFTVGTDNGANASGDSFIAYCFAEVKGYSKFASYTGNGDANGTFVYTGFKPAFVIIKRSDTAGSGWVLLDNKRNAFNPENARMEANSSGAEATDINLCDFISNGFKFRDTNSIVNASGGTYIYMAFSENPFVSSKGIPACAR